MMNAMRMGVQSWKVTLMKTRISVNHVRNMLFFYREVCSRGNMKTDFLLLIIFFSVVCLERWDLSASSSSSFFFLVLSLLKKKRKHQQFKH